MEKVFAAICRCGTSNSKPNCDVSHAKIEFKAEAINAAFKIDKISNQI